MTGRVLSMTPTDFAFSMTVPRDVRFVQIIKDVAGHVVTYSAMDATHGKAFVAQVVTAAERVLGHGHGEPCDLQIACEHGELRFTIAGETLRQRVAP